MSTPLARVYNANVNMPRVISEESFTWDPPRRGAAPAGRWGPSNADNAEGVDLRERLQFPRGFESREGFIGANMVGKAVH